MDPDFSAACSEDVEFALQGRAAFPEVLRERAVLLENSALLAVLQALPGPVMVFNEHRQLLHANEAALREAEENVLSNLLGLRIGEILGCENAGGCPGGCGSTPHCCPCSNTQAILAALGGREAEGKVILRRDRQGRSIDHAYNVRAIPLPGGSGPCVCVFVDRLEDPVPHK